jgi:hypothetical protein
MFYPDIDYCQALNLKRTQTQETNSVRIHAVPDPDLGYSKSKPMVPVTTKNIIRFFCIVLGETTGLDLQKIKNKNR